MRAAIGIGDGIGKGQNLVVVAVVVLHDDIDKDFIALAGNDHRLRVNDLFVFPELLHELLDAVLVEEGFLLQGLDPLVRENDFQARIQEGQLAQTAGQALEFEFGGDGEDRRVRQESDEGAAVLLVFDFADDAEFVGRLSPGESHVMDLAVARDFDLEPIGEGVGALGSDTMQASGIFVGALPEFSAGVQVGEHELDRGHLPFRMDINRNAAAVIPHGDRTVHVHGHLNFGAIAGQMLVDGVIEHLEDEMMQTAFIGVADIHPGPFAHGLQPLQFVDLGGVVLLGF